MPERMHRRVGIHLRLGYGPAKDLLDAAGAVLPAVLAFEEPVRRPVDSQILGQQRGHLIGEHRVAVFFAFAAANVNSLPRYVQVMEREAQHLAQPQATAVEQHQHAAMLEVAGERQLLSCRKMQNSWVSFLPSE